MPLISVIIPVYNEDKYLASCLESLSKQEGVEFEILVVDDGSNPPVSLEKLKNGKVYRRKHNGTAFSRNFGAEKAKGNILVFIDGDMVFSKDFLNALTKPIKSKKSKGTYSSEEFVANWENVWARCWNYENGLMTKRRIDPNRKDMVKDFRAILASEFKRVGGFDNTGYTDTWTLSQKLGYYPTETKAHYFHYNPSSLSEVYKQAAWIGKRERKLGIWGKGMAFARALPPLSLIKGLVGLLKFSEMGYLPFKVVYDLGTLYGISEHLFGRKYSK